MRLALVFAACLASAAVMSLPSRAGETVIDLGTAQLSLTDNGGWSEIKFADGTQWKFSNTDAFWIETPKGRVLPTRVERAGDRLHVTFDDGTLAKFSLKPDRGFAVVKLEELAAKSEIQRFRAFRIPLPLSSEIAAALNAGFAGSEAVALMAAEVNLQAIVDSSGGSRADRAGCSHEFEPVAEAKVGSKAARFTAKCNDQPGGWSMRGRSLPRPLDLTGCQAIRAWVNGDGKGESLKIQLFDGAGGYRDEYIVVDFKGWRQFTLTGVSINSLRYDRVQSVNFYYNNLPPSSEVSCLIDHVEAVLKRDGKEEVVLLEDFEDAQSPLWSSPVHTLSLESGADHGIQPVRFGIIACPRTEFMETVRRFELASGVPSPSLGNVWNKQSPWIHRSYFFLTGFRESEFDEALAIAKRGGFDLILIDQGSWCASTGHYDVNRERFPDGLESLKRTVRRFHDAGFRVGFHTLAASIYPPDAYLTPVPDPRLVTGAKITLSGDLDAKANFVPTESAPDAFPAKDGGYEGNGTVLRIGDELIQYGRRSMESPFGFAECQRGYLGTRAAAHAKGETAKLLTRSYGYHMYDMDTTLLDEVAGNFAQVANACGIDMVYFDGSEALQGDHWYYNARMHKAFYDKLENKDVLLQASSFSHYSWHLMARTASADGHGDLKGYLDERSPGFEYMAFNGMPLDIGWYYGYDTSATPDMYEYILGATIGYGASVSFQVSPEAAARHPFTGEILDLIGRYEKLRLSGRVPDAMRARLRIDPMMGGVKDDEARARLAEQRRDFRLITDGNRAAFQRVFYTPWRELKSAAPDDSLWKVNVPQGPARIGWQVHAQPGPWLSAPPSYQSKDALLLESFDDLAPYAAKPVGKAADGRVESLKPGEAGSTLPGVTQEIKLATDPQRGESRFAVYTATSSLGGPEGWSVFGKAFSQPLDISWHKAIGFWMQGDGRGGLFKLQLCDDKGAMDYYVPNDFTGWRYQQLERPAKDAIDYQRVRSLLFYYNGLPGNTQVACGIDDVKALRSADVRTLRDPFVEIDGRRYAFSGELKEGQYVMVWPGEPTCQFGPTAADQRGLSVPGPDLTLPAGEHSVRFGCATDLLMPVRVRVTAQPPERYEVP